MITPLQTAPFSIVRCNGAGRSGLVDSVAVEAPLEISLKYRKGRWRVVRVVSVTMRTPGEDVELAAGFLVSEGVVRRRGELVRIVQTGENAVEIGLDDAVRVDAGKLERHFASTASCGVCGKLTVETTASALGSHAVFEGDGVSISERRLHAMPTTLREAQKTFRSTGGLHAAGLFDMEGRLLALREDIGRHNAVDKVLGAAWLGEVPRGSVLLVSGRAGFELVQKAIAHRVPFLAAVGAPSSLAVEYARRFGSTLVGFLRDGKFNIYTGAHRVVH